MSFNPSQMRKLVRNVLEYLEPEIPYSLVAEDLILMTMAQESHFGTYIEQLGTGPAQGVCQMEPATESDIWSNYLHYKPLLFAKVDGLAGVNGEMDAVGNLPYQIAMCRVHYRRVSEALPSPPQKQWDEAEYLNRLAQYWKKHYNTYLGAGTPEEAVKNYQRFVLDNE